MNTNRLVAIAGNIGVGKTTLTRLLAEEFGWMPCFEPVTENPYLERFYQNMHRWAYLCQEYFLRSRVVHYQGLIRGRRSAMLDRTPYEDRLFEQNLVQCGHMTPEDDARYQELYQQEVLNLRPPDLVIYLQARVPTLLERIRGRGREFERGISPLYLHQLNVLYNQWADEFTLCPVLVIPADQIDFVRVDGHLNCIVGQVQSELSKL